MKIDGPKSSSDIQKKKEAKKASGGDGAFGALMDSGAAEDTAGAGRSGLSAGIAGIDALLAAQAADDPMQGKARQAAKRRATDILEKLQNLKLAMMTGRVTIGHMVSIADVVASHRDQINDPDLTAILDEIDLRAHVELTKLKIARSKMI